MGKLYRYLLIRCDELPAPLQPMPRYKGNVRTRQEIHGTEKTIIDGEIIRLAGPYVRYAAPRPMYARIFVFYGRTRPSNEGGEIIRPSPPIFSLSLISLLARVLLLVCRRSI